MASLSFYIIALIIMVSIPVGKRLLREFRIIKIEEYLRSSGEGSSEKKKSLHEEIYGEIRPIEMMSKEDRALAMADEAQERGINSDDIRAKMRSIIGCSCDSVQKQLCECRGGCRCHEWDDK